MGAAFVMNPALGRALTSEGLAGVEVPVCIVACEADTVAPARTNACRFAELIRGAQLSLREPPADHYVFVCKAIDAGKRLAPESCVDAAGIDCRAIHERTGEMPASFLDARLGAGAKR